MSISLSIGRTPNYASLRLGNVRLEFSYETVIAFDAGDGLVVRQNDWGPTTGKHLNALDGGGAKAKARRLPSDEFRMRLAAVTDRIDAALEHA